VNERNKQIKVLGWSCAAAYFVIFFDCFFLPYAKGDLIFSTLYVSPLDMIRIGYLLSDAGGGNTALFVLAFFVLAPAGCIIAAVATAMCGKGKIHRSFYALAALFGAIALAIHLYFFSTVANGDIISAAFGFFFNSFLLLLAVSFSVGLFTLSSKGSTIRSASFAGNNGQKVTYPGPEDNGVIVGKTGMYRNAVFKIKSGEELIIGRDAALSHIIVDTGAEKVSRKHCSIVYDGHLGQYIVTDYSSNGTYTEDGVRLPNKVMYSLPRGTTIYLGNRQNSFKLN